MNQDILALIQENMNTFSKGQKRIAAFILDSYDKAAGRLRCWKNPSCLSVSEFWDFFSGFSRIPAALEALDLRSLTRPSRPSRPSVRNIPSRSS